MPTAAKTLLRFFLLSSTLLIPAILLWQNGQGASSLLPVFDHDRGWYGYLLSALVRRPTLDMLMFYGDVPLLFIAVIALARLGCSLRLAAWLGAGGFLTMALFQAYHQLSWWAQQQPPMIVADMALIPAAQHFLASLDSVGLMAVAAALGVIAITASAARLLAGLIRDSRESVAPYLVSLGLVAYAASVAIMVGGQRSDTVGKWLAKDLAANISRSLDHNALTAKLDSLPVDDRYQRLMATPATKTPNVLLYVMESYGDLLLTDPRYRKGFAELMLKSEQKLRGAGWQAAHSLSAAPVHGGKSWFSTATLLTGVNIAYPSHFQKFTAMSGDYPHLVRWLSASGYETYGVFPATKSRPTLPVVNTYDFDHYLTSEQIPYGGASQGWAPMPDQYALGFGLSQLKAGSEAPKFMLFSSASSHSPWRQPAPLAADWRDAGKEQSAGAADEGARQQLVNALANRLRRRIGQDDIGSHYLSQIAAQWQLIEQVAMAKDNPFSVIIVIGDHQPPLLQDRESASFATPIHVFVRDKALVEPLISGGFVSSIGQILAARPIRHEGLYQLVADMLTGRKPEVAAAPWRQGASLGAFKL